MNQQVARATLPAGQSLTDFLLNQCKPVVLPGLVSQWPVVEVAGQGDTSLLDYLARFDSGVQVDAIEMPAQAHGRMFYNDTMSGFNFSRQRVPFTHILQRLSAAVQAPKDNPAPTLYVGSTSVDTCVPGFSAYNTVPLDTLNPLATLWLGQPSRIAAHYDVPDNLICVAAGKRTVTLFPPDEVANLYIGPLHLTPAGQAISLVDFQQPDWDRFPRFKTALNNAQTIELNAGDALFIPSMWWHHIEAHAPLNLLVNYWWRTTPAFVGRGDNALYHALLNLRQLPAKERRAWQALFDFYVFSDDEKRFDHIPETLRGPLGQSSEATIKQFSAWLANSLKR